MKLDKRWIIIAVQFAYLKYKLKGISSIGYRN
jgi:hypothetical protein